MPRFKKGQEPGPGRPAGSANTVRSFEAACLNFDGAKKLEYEECFGLLGAALLRTGWTKDLSVLSSSVLVVVS
jgi:hypothetical protein